MVHVMISAAPAPPTATGPSTIAEPTGFTRQIHPVALGAAWLLAVFDLLLGMLLVSNIYTMLLGPPLLIGGIVQMVLLRRHRNPWAVHPATITGFMALAGLLASAVLLSRWGASEIVIFGIRVYATHVVIAAALWLTTTVTDTSDRG